MFTKVIPKLVDKKEQCISELSIGIFIDNSGSTSGSMLNKLSVLDNETKIRSIIGENSMTHYVLWNSNATEYKTQKAMPEGGTYPSCIARDNICLEYFMNCSVLIFLTDGDIDHTAVSQFSEIVNNNLNKQLIVCIQYSNQRSDNISVFAPFLLSKNLLIIHNDSINQLIMYSKGEIASSFKKDQKIDLDILKKIKVTNSYPPIPENCILLSDDEKSIKVFNFEEFMRMKEFNMNMLTEEDWDNICKMAKMNNLLVKLRNKVNELRNDSINATINYLKTIIKAPIVTLKNEIICNIMKLDEKKVDQHNEERIKLVKELQSILPKARIEEAENTKQINEKLYDIRKYWEVVRNILNHYESASYSLNDMAGIGNRAKRATVLSDNEFDITTIVHNNVPQIECALHLDKGPSVIWLNKPDDLKDTMNDHILTFPLDYSPKLVGCIKSNPVCGDCASGYMEYSKNMSLYREPITGYIPCDIKNNKQFVKKQLCKILVDNKLLGHVESLLLSIVDDNNSSWFDKDIKDFIINQLIENIITTDTFTEEGTKTTLKNAINGLNTERILRQPLIAALRLLLFLAKYFPTKHGDVISLVKERFAYYLIENINDMLMDNNSQRIEDYVNSLLYTTQCGIPTIKNLDSVKLPTINDVAGLFRTGSFSKSIEMLKKICDMINMKDVNDLITPSFIALILISFKSLKIHERPLTIYNKLLNNKFFSQSFSMKNDEKIVKKVIIDDLVAKYTQCRNPEVWIPSYACYLGVNSSPSKLFFDNKPLVPQDTKINDNTPELLRIALADSLGKTYGTVYPSETSSHINLHRTVAHVIEEQFPNNNTPTNDMYIAVIDKLKKTRGKKGNIYQDELVGQIICCVNDFLRIRNEAKLSPKDWKFDPKNITFSYKVKKELEYHGLSTVIDYHKIKSPINIITLNNKETLNKLSNELNILTNEKI